MPSLSMSPPALAAAGSGTVYLALKCSVRSSLSDMPLSYLSPPNDEETALPALRTGLSLAALLVAGAIAAAAQAQPAPKPAGKPLEKATLALQWLTQCQFAGYYVALEKGYYRDEGIE